MFFSLSYSFGIETIKYVPRLRRSLENHTQLQIKMGSVYPLSDQNGAKTLSHGAAHTCMYMAYLWHYPFSPGRRCQTLFRQLA